ncbi:helicase SNF [Paenibacillus faecis]|uniref:DEAD/DEAH box helicase n=1 Tax=Paenibacillus faecis TaxID=862114 RepID=UPI001B024050|nr:DEAD/DEAH box helicase [Paenibacillus faecis]GIO88642.1 helicase SNF [Paenibacillus faecis]
MSSPLTERLIKLLCGRIAYDRGEAYFRQKRVSFTHTEPETGHYQAIVRGTDSYRVFVHIDLNGDVSAECQCPAYALYNNHCKHIAAVLLGIREQQAGSRMPARSVSLLHPEGRPSGDTFTGLTERYDPSGRRSGGSSRDVWLTRDVMGLFEQGGVRRKTAGSRFDARIRLQAEFILKTSYIGPNLYVFGVELKIGGGRLYIVKHIRDFLDHLERGESYPFSEQFSYDPAQHSFEPSQDVILRQLIEISRNERLYQEEARWSGGAARRNKENRTLLLPPYAWAELLRGFRASPSSIKLDPGHGKPRPFVISDDPLPVNYRFDRAEDGGYRLDVEGLADLKILESYGLVLADGILRNLQVDRCRRLRELKNMLEASRRNHIHIAAEQMEPFMQRVLPGLQRMGSVQIADAVTERMVRSPLKARLYLDRVRNRLLAGLEFQYGDIVLNPLESGTARGSDLILMRDEEQESRILQMMDESSFVKTESGYFLDDEDAEYDFLVHIVPRLEQLLEVYATSAVKTRIVPVSAPPKVSVQLGERTDWLEVSIDLSGISEQEIRGVIQALAVKRKYYRLPEGALLPLDHDNFKQIVALMNDLGPHLIGEAGNEFRVPVTKGLHLLDEHKYGSSIKLDKNFRLLLHHIKNPDSLDFPVPPQLASVLRDYQAYGYQWMKMLAHYRFGGILADDMGLGKTLQSIAFLVSVLPEIRDQQQPALIVAPASLVYNWRNELRKFAPDIRCEVADGSKSDRLDVLKRAGTTDVLIVSYPVLRMDIEEFAKHAFHSMFLDEAQTFKNYATQTAQAVKALQAKHRFALTGTPVENKLEELWSIYDVVFPSLFQSRQQFHELSREQIARMIRPFLLRRLKTDVLKELPEKIETVQTSELLPDQKKLYAALLAQLQQETLKHLNEESFQKNRIRILAGLTRLRQLCCHPSLFVEDYEGGSAKFEQLLEITEECLGAGRRLLIFSQFTEMLGMIGKELGYRGVPFFYLDGKTPPAERVELCSRFNEGERDIFLISLKAGGTGLNLTGADTVILYDLWWNPAVEQQAADRAHRMGQKNVVQVIRLITENTVEEKMYELQQKKRDLIDEVIEPGQEALSSLTEQEIREILMI